MVVTRSAQGCGNDVMAEIFIQRWNTQGRNFWCTEEERSKQCSDTPCWLRTGGPSHVSSGWNWRGQFLHSATSSQTSIKKHIPNEKHYNAITEVSRHRAPYHTYGIISDICYQFILLLYQTKEIVVSAFPLGKCHWGEWGEDWQNSK